MAARVPNNGQVYEHAIRFVGFSPLGERMYLVPVHDDVDLGRDPHGEGNDPYTALALVVDGRFGGIGTVCPLAFSSLLRPRGLVSTENPAVGPAADALRAARDVSAALKRGQWLVAIVPDGVATVRISWRDGTSMDLPVRDNVAIGHSDRELGGTSTIWLDAGGAPLP